MWIFLTLAGQLGLSGPSPSFQVAGPSTSNLDDTGINWDTHGQSKHEKNWLHYWRCFFSAPSTLHRFRPGHGLTHKGRWFDNGVAANGNHAMKFTFYGASNSVTVLNTENTHAVRGQETKLEFPYENKQPVDPFQLPSM